MIVSFLDTTKSNDLADWIIAEVKRAVPTDLAARKTKKKHVGRAREMDANIAKRVVEFARTTPLNVYKKARFAARVREGLSEHGYPEEFVRSFSLELIERIQTAKKV